MTTIDRLIVNSPNQEPAQHWRYAPLRRCSAASI